MSFIGNPNEFIYDALLYPNPVNKELNIEFHEPNNFIKSASLLNAAGQLIKSTALHQIAKNKPSSWMIFNQEFIL